MKSKYWILVIASIFIVSCVLAVVFLLPGKPAAFAEIWQDNRLVRTVDLKVDQSFTVQTEGGYNMITVENGKIAITDADCPDKHCIRRGYCNSGSAIVCLPHRLVIKFVEKGDIDGVVG